MIIEIGKKIEIQYQNEDRDSATAVLLQNNEVVTWYEEDEENSYYNRMLFYTLENFLRHLEDGCFKIL